MKFKYHIEVQGPPPGGGEPVWQRCMGEVTREWGLGYLDCYASTPGPRLALRLYKQPTGLCCGSDDCPERAKMLAKSGTVAAVSARSDVSLGQMAGMPGWREYTAAAAKALERASRDPDEECPRHWLEDLAKEARGALGPA